MAINFPSTTGQATDGSFTHTASGVTWAWDGTTWQSQGVTGAYVLPTATATSLGGVKVGSGLTINSTTSVLSASASAITIEEEGTALTNAATTINFVGEGVTAAGTGATKTITVDSSPILTWNLNASGAQHYQFTGPGLNGSVDDPTLYLIRGQTYHFVNNTSGTSHPFQIQSTAGTSGAAYNTGVTGNGGTNGVTIKFEVPLDAPDTLYYQCTDHENMQGTINVLNASSGGATTLGALTDVDTTGAANGKILKHNGTSWVVGDDATTTGLQSRTTGQATSAGLANNAAGNLTIVAAKTYALHKIQTSHAAWVTLYTDSTARTNDAARTETTDPLPGSGIIAEVITSDGAIQPITPGTIGWNNEGTPTTNAYVKVVNKSGSTADVTVTLHFVALEA